LAVLLCAQRQPDGRIDNLLILAEAVSLVADEEKVPLTKSVSAPLIGQRQAPLAASRTLAGMPRFERPMGLGEVDEKRATTPRPVSNAFQLEIPQSIDEAHGGTKTSPSLWRPF
jgi:hypothetical protein